MCRHEQRESISDFNLKIQACELLYIIRTVSFANVTVQLCLIFVSNRKCTN